MSIWELLLLAVSLATDAFAISMCKGLAMGKVRLRDCAVMGLWFGGFQALMPFLGYFLGSTFADYIEKIDHWIAFGLLVLIGGNMLREAIFSCEEEEADASLAPLGMLAMAVATSIDALAVGVTLPGMVESTGHMIFTIAAIGVITFVLAGVGGFLGTVCGTRFKKAAEILGGSILVLLGVKMLLEGLGVLS